jgi:hypothetical protein
MSDAVGACEHNGSGVGVRVAKGVNGIGVGARVGEVIQLLSLYGTPNDCDETNVPLGKVLAIQKRDQGYCTTSCVAPLGRG